MCGCFDRVNSGLFEHNGFLEMNLLASPPRAMVAVGKRSPRGRKAPLLEASYCPFCGDKYKDKKRALAQAQDKHE
jgi:hypothetical protein